MIDWAARARAQLAQQRQGGGDENDETQVLSVSSVRPQGCVPANERLSSVSSLPAEGVVAERIKGAGTTGAAATNDVNDGARLEPVRASGNPYMTVEQGDDCHAGGWDDAEIESFIVNAARFALWRRADAEHLAERLILRDRQADDRHYCVECGELELSGRCAAARRGAMPGFDRRLEPVQNILARCLAFRSTGHGDQIYKGV